MIQLSVRAGEGVHTFRLVSVGGKTSTTMTEGGLTSQESQLTVALITPLNMPIDLFYRLLVQLTKDAWHGFIVYDTSVNKRPPQLSNWHVRMPSDTDDADAHLIVRISYKVFVPDYTLSYTLNPTE